ncbi:MAG: hypothetical protein ACFFD4_31525 [Candidatus Odinarchaeota archaeon]
MQARELGKWLVIIGTVLMAIIAVAFSLYALDIIQADFTGGYLFQVGSLLSIVEMNPIFHGIIMFVVAIISVYLIQRCNFGHKTKDHIWWGIAWIVLGFIGGGWGGLCMIFGGAALFLDPIL